MNFDIISSSSPGKFDFNFYAPDVGNDVVVVVGGSESFRGLTKELSILMIGLDFLKEFLFEIYS